MVSPLDGFLNLLLQVRAEGRKSIMQVLDIQFTSSCAFESRHDGISADKQLGVPKLRRCCSDKPEPAEMAQFLHHPIDDRSLSCIGSLHIENRFYAV